jgi:hypothetical protein
MAKKHSATDRVVRGKLKPEAVQKFWSQFVERNIKRIQPYEEARALSQAVAGQNVCR